MHAQPAQQEERNIAMIIASSWKKKHLSFHKSYKSSCVKQTAGEFDDIQL